MALRNNENKVKFGLKRVAFAVATIAEDGSATYGDVISFPGARTLSMEPQGAGESWHADDGVYYFSSAPVSRQGDLEMARIIDSFKRIVLKYIQDAKGLLLEDTNPAEVHFALLFETTNDKKPRRYVMYNCVATAPTVGSATNEGSKEPQTETSTITSSGIYVASHDKWFDHGETTPATDPEAYANWFSAVQVPGAPPAPYPVKTASGSPVVITDGAANMAVEAMTVTVNPVQAAGTPTPEAPLPISGWTGANVTRCGKNLFDQSQMIDQSDWNTILLYAPPGTQLTMSSSAPAKATSGLEVHFCIPGEPMANANAVYADRSRTKTVPEAGYVRIIQSRTFGTDSFQSYHFQIEIGATATEYEPYVGTTYDITFPTEAGTVYGGTLNVTTGVLTVDRTCVEFDGSSDEIIYSELDGQRAKIPNGAPGVEATSGRISVMCNIGTTTSGSDPNTVFANADASIYYYFPTSPMTVEQFRTLLANTPMQVVYKLATPVPIQLTPAEVRTLLGDNTIWADTGDVTVSYHSDPIFDD